MRKQNISMAKTEETFMRHKCVWENNINIDLNWVIVDQNGDKRLSCEQANEFSVCIKAGRFLSS
jgi:hypothetical protein